MAEYHDKSEYNKNYYVKNNPFPIRLGDLKGKLQIEAFEKNMSLSETLKDILNSHFEKKEGIMEGS